MKKILLSSLLASLNLLVYQNIIRIPEDYASLNEAFAAADEGDTILVSPGTYQENFRIEAAKQLKIGSKFMTTGDTTYISRTIISGGSVGPAVQFDPGVTSSTEFTGFTLTRGTGIDGMGGAIYMEDATPMMHNLCIHNNSAGQGGAIACTWGKLILYHSRILNNTATNRGGAIHLLNSSMDINTCEIRDNQVVGGLGGAISYYVGTGLSEMPNVYMNSALIINNKSTGTGVTAGAYFEAPENSSSPLSMNIKNSLFEGNISTSSSAMRIRGNIRFSIQNCLFLSNEAAEYTGGATFSNSCEGDVVNCLFASNKGATSGGTYNSGAVTVWSASAVEFYNCGFVKNTATIGTAMTLGGAGASLTNCIFWGNGAEHITLLDINQVGSSLTVKHCDIQNSQASITVKPLSQLHWNEGNINADPLFPDSGDHPYGLVTGSPCIDAGTPQTMNLPLPDGDIAGRTRIWDGDGNGSALIDIGPYEFGSPPVGISAISKHPDPSLRTRVYPNPSSSAVTLEFYLPRPSDVMLEIYNNHGMLVHSREGKHPQGLNNFKWDSDRLSSGIYHYILQAEGVSSTGNINIIK